MGVFFELNCRFFVIEFELFNEQSTHLFKHLSFWILDGLLCIHTKRKRKHWAVFCYVKCDKNVRNSMSKIINCSKWKVNRRWDSHCSRSISMLWYSICNTYIFTNISSYVCRSIRLELYKLREWNTLNTFNGRRNTKTTHAQNRNNHFIMFR